YGSPNVCLTSAGVLYPATVVTANLPLVQLPGAGVPTIAAFASNWQPVSIAKLAVEARKLPFTGVIRISVEDRGVVCLNMGSGRVVLGSTEDLDKKLQVLRTRMAAYPTELSTNKE